MPIAHAIFGGIAIANLVFIALAALLFFVSMKKNWPGELGAISIAVAAIGVVNLIIFGSVWLATFPH